MLFFDRIEMRNINGVIRLFAVDDLKGESYPLHNVVISTEASQISGFRLSVNSISRREPFQNSDLMGEFSSNIMKLARYSEL